MRYKLTLTLILALIALAVPTTVVKPSATSTAAVKHSAMPTPPVVGVTCECIAYGRLLCISEVSGGTAPYTYQWGPPPISGSGQIKVVPCSGNGTRIITLTVTDANGEIGYFSAPFTCCGPVG
ncbi:MAG TPA: hypothetical protein VNO50_12905 [Pyrinomonadaceae bacterium]|nr:hypothetical protein [Pyrinomonadaceae bacterium]